MKGLECTPQYYSDTAVGAGGGGDDDDDDHLCVWNHADIDLYSAMQRTFFHFFSIYVCCCDYLLANSLVFKMFC